MRLDVIRDAGGDDEAFRQHRAQRLALQLTACATIPLRFVVQPSHR
jgi:hypothetical protein